MKFTVTMKDPDTLHDAIEEAVVEYVNGLTGHLDEDDREDIIQNRKEKIAEICQKWFRYGEYLSVEIDTEAGTASVCEAK